MAFSKYPNQIDTSTELPVVVDLQTPVNAEVMNRFRDAVLAVESELGILPSGTYGTVRARLDAMSAVSSTIGSINGVYDEGVLVREDVRELNFIGPATVATPAAEDGRVDITISASGGGGGSPVLYQEQETLPVTINGQTSFTLGNTPEDETAVEMYVNGFKQDYGTDYTVSGSSVTFSSTDLSLITTDVVEFWYLAVGDGSIVQEQESVAVTISGQILFALSFMPADNNAVKMFINGQKQENGVEYTVAGNAVTYTGPLTLDTTDVIEFWYIISGVVSGGLGSSQTLGQTLKIGNTTDGYDIIISDGDSIIGQTGLSTFNAIDVTVAGGAAVGTGLGGDLFLSGGAAASNTGGNVSITSGSGSVAGDILFITGNGSGAGGDIIFNLVNSGASSDGFVKLQEDGVDCIKIQVDDPYLSWDYVKLVPIDRDFSIDYDNVVASTAKGRDIQLWAQDAASGYVSGKVIITGGTSVSVYGAYIEAKGGSSISNHGGDFDVLTGDVSASGNVSSGIATIKTGNATSTTNGNEIVGDIHFRTGSLSATTGTATAGNIILNILNTNADVKGAVQFQETNSTYLTLEKITNPTFTPASGRLDVVGDGYVTGDFTIKGKLTVDGLIDPTGLVLDEQTAGFGASTVSTGKGVVWVDGSVSPNRLIFTNETGSDSVVSGLGSGDETLSQTLALGNTTDGYDIVLTESGGVGDNISATRTSQSFDIAITNAHAGNAQILNILGQDSSASAGGDIYVTSGDGAGTGSGGRLYLQGGAGTGTGPGGDIYLSSASGSTAGKINIIAADGSGSPSAGGGVLISGGAGNGSGADGNLDFRVHEDSSSTSLNGRFIFNAAVGESTYPFITIYRDTASSNHSILEFHNTAISPNIRQKTQSAANTSGETLSIISQTGFGAASGGALTLTAGNSGSGATGTGGHLNVNAGDAVSTNGDGGTIYLNPGLGNGTGVDGYVNIDGDLSISGKLTVVGLIDPTGLVLDEQAAGFGAANVADGKGILWVDGSVSPNKLMFTNETGEDLTLDGYSSTNTLSKVLSVGNATDGYNILISSGDGIVGEDSLIDGAGGAITITAGDGYANGNGGAVSITSGAGGDSGGGGHINLTTSGSTAGDGNGGSFNVITGNSLFGSGGDAVFNLGNAGNGEATGGSFQVTAGNSIYSAVEAGSILLTAGGGSSGGNGGDVTIDAGQGNGVTSTSGDATINGGTGLGGCNAGHLFLVGGQAFSNGLGGNINITGGAASTGNAGNVSITGGTSSSSSAGELTLTNGLGSATDGNINLNMVTGASDGYVRFQIDGADAFSMDADNVLFLANTSTVPTTTPTGGGRMYAEAGAAKWMGTSGTVTTFGPADPHCEKCGRDFALQWESNQYGKLTACMWCLTDAIENAGISLDKFVKKEP